MKRIVVLALAIFALLTSTTGKGNTDYCGDYDFPRIAAQKQAPCTLRIMSLNIRVVYVHVNTHFNHVSEQARVQAAALVSAYIEGHFSDVPVVFTADMNTTEKGEACATMTQNLTDARCAAKDCVTFGTFHGGHDPNEKTGYYIDFVLCSSDFSVETYRTVTKGFSNRFTSDYIPIYADLKL